LPWHSDFKTGREWPLQYSPDIEYAELDRSTDVKVPWELSRCQHFAVLGQAYWLSGDERYAQEFVDEVEDWIARNPWGYGVNWVCAMDVALRAVSWVWGFYFMGASAACAAPAFRSAFLRALYLHGEHIATHLERSDVNGNHYLCDALGLVFLGSFFRSTAKGRRWLATGRGMVAAEMFNPTSDDGGDFEKSTPYHRLVLEALLTCGILLARHGEPFEPAWQSRLERMLEFVEAYVKPDGRLPLIGDADDGRIQKLGSQPVNDHRYLLAAGGAIGRADFNEPRHGDEAFWLLGVKVRQRSTAYWRRRFNRRRCDGASKTARSRPRLRDCEVGMHGRVVTANDILSFSLARRDELVSIAAPTSIPRASGATAAALPPNVAQIDDEELAVRVPR
jgi:hypothetical protein